MNATKIGGLIAIVFGLGIVATQIVREVPWQAGIAAGLFIAFCGAIALADSNVPPTDGGGGEIVPFERR